MPVVIFSVCIVCGLGLLIYIGMLGYNKWQKNKYGPLQKDIGFEGKRFRILKYLSEKETTVNRLNVIEDLEIDIPTFKRVVNSLTRDKLVSTGPQSIKITSFGNKYHDIFLK